MQQRTAPGIDCRPIKFSVNLTISPLELYAARINLDYPDADMRISGQRDSGVTPAAFVPFCAIFAQHSATYSPQNTLKPRFSSHWKRTVGAAEFVFEALSPS